MTLLCMAAEYRRGGDLIRLRIIALKDALQSADPLEAVRLEQRIRELETMYRETRAIARVLEHYYDRRYHDRGSCTY